MDSMHISFVFGLSLGLSLGISLGLVLGLVFNRGGHYHEYMN